jgi:hypothetical protein
MLLVVAVSRVNPAVARHLGGAFEMGVFTVRGHVFFEVAESASGLDVSPTAWKFGWALPGAYSYRHPPFTAHILHPAFEIIGVLQVLYNAEDPSGGACCDKTVGCPGAFDPALVFG